MKRFFALLITLLVIPAIAFAAGLPDYQKGKLTTSYSCDAGKTVAKSYEDADNKWGADEYRTASGDVFVEFYSGDANDGFHMKLAGSTEMKKVSHTEWDAALKAKSLAAYNELHGGQNDCKQVTK